MGYETLLDKHIRSIFETLHFYITIFIFALSVAFTDTATSRPDSHAPIGMMGEHGHKAGEMMWTQVVVVVQNLSQSNFY